MSTYIRPKVKTLNRLALGGSVIGGQAPSVAQQGVGAFGPIGAAIGAVSGAGVQAGNAIGGKTGGAISGMFDPAAALQDKNLSVGKRLLGATVPMLGGIWSQKGRAKQAEEAKRWEKYGKSVQRGQAALASGEPQQQYTPMFGGGGSVPSNTPSVYRGNLLNLAGTIDRNFINNPSLDTKTKVITSRTGKDLIAEMPHTMSDLVNKGNLNEMNYFNNLYSRLQPSLTDENMQTLTKGNDPINLYKKAKILGGAQLYKNDLDSLQKYAPEFYEKYNVEMARPLLKKQFANGGSVPVSTTKTESFTKPIVKGLGTTKDDAGKFSEEQLKQAMLQGKESEFWQYNARNNANDAYNLEHYNQRLSKTGVTPATLHTIGAIAGGMPMYAQGGLTTSGVELEGGESFVTPEGENMNVEGPSHSQGGVPMELPVQTQVFSDRLKVPGTNKTFSDINKTNAKDIKKYQDILDSNKHTRLAKHTATKNLQKAEQQQEMLFQMQQMLNGNSNGQSSVGNMPKGANGLEVVNPMSGVGGVASNALSVGMQTYANRNVPQSANGGKFANGMNNLLQAAPALYNIGQGLFGKVQKLNPADYYNQFEGEVLSTMKNRRTNVDPLLESNRQAFNIGNRNIATASRTRGEMLSGYATTAAGKSAADASVLANAQNVDNQYLGEYANMLSNFGAQRASTKFNVANINDQNRTAKNRYLQQGLTDLSSYVANNKIMKGQQKADDTRINALNSLLENYYWDNKAGEYKLK